MSIQQLAETAFKAYFSSKGWEGRTTGTPKPEFHEADLGTRLAWEAVAKAVSDAVLDRVEEHVKQARN